MGIETIITAVMLLASSLGAFYGGRRTAGEQTIAAATVTVDMLQVQADLLAKQLEERDIKIAALEAKMEILESLVTQRAEVEEVKQEVQGVRSVVDRIAHKVGA